MAWIYLIVAGFFEWGRPLGLKLGWTDKGAHYGWLAFSISCMVVSGGLLLVAQRTLPMGTANAVWTGIGAVGTFILGIIFFWRGSYPGAFLFCRFDHSRHPGTEAGFYPLKAALKNSIFSRSPNLKTRGVS